MTCMCYCAERNLLGKIGVCLGTKKSKACSCEGDETKCDFYVYVRERAKSLTKKPTNADHIRAMTNEELAMLLQPTCPTNQCPDEIPHDCYKCWLDWLNKEE